MDSIRKQILVIYFTNPKTVTYLDILPSHISKKIWQEVNGENIKKILEFALYKYMLQTTIYFHFNNYSKLDIGIKRYIIYVPLEMDHNTKLVARVSIDGFKKMLSSCFYEVENGNTCGIFNPRIIRTGVQMYNLIIVYLTYV